MPYWFLVALIAPFLWALVAIIDTYFVHNVYEDEYDGALVSGLFPLLPWLFVPLGIIQFVWPGLVITSLSVLAGSLFILSFFFYFRALFLFNDSALMQTLWGLSVLVVPFFSWMILDEVLLFKHYVGVSLAFLGILFFHFDIKVKQVGFSRVIGLMLLSVFFYSASMVIGKVAYDGAFAEFWSILLLFSIGTAVTPILLLIFRKKSILSKASNIVKLSQKYFFVFAFSEGISMVATIASQKAISLAPSATFVIVVESLVPIYVMVMSFMLVIVLPVVTGSSSIKDIYTMQFSRFGVKLAAIVAITAGVYAVALS